MDVLSTFSTRKTPQNQRADSRQERNAAGGFTFVTDDWTRVHRFLTIGVEGGTYYVDAKTLAVENAQAIIKAAANDPVRLVKAIVEVSTAGRAPRNNPALFALAIAASCESADGRKAALAALPLVARTGTHLFQFAGYVEQFRGWGRGLRRAVADWYTSKDVDQLAYQMVKYRQREGWTHRDLLRLSHPDHTPGRSTLFDWACGREGENMADLPPIVLDFLEAQQAEVLSDKVSTHRWVDIINRGNGISWEMLPDAALGEIAVWEALVARGLPQTALMRQLPRLTRLGLFNSADIRREVCEQLKDPELLKRGRVHPINVLVAMATYASGRSAAGTSTWTPDRHVVNALDGAFYNAFGAVEPAGKRTLLGLDVSGSMGSSAGGLPITCRVVSAALALVTMASEPDGAVMGFSHQFVPLDIDPRRRLDDNVNAISRIPYGATDCALPILFALQNKIEVDTFQVYTDNETFYGNIHPHQALEQYRQKMGIDARLAVVALTATNRTIADPADPGMIDVSGFDSTVPSLLADFSRGEL